MKHLARLIVSSFLILVSSFPLSGHAQTKQVLKGISTNALTESIVIPTGKSITIDAGATIINNGTATGFTSGLAIGTSAITGGTSGHVLYNNSGTLGGVDLSAVYQALNTNLTTIANLANGTGVLTNNGSGTFSYTATSTGGNSSADSGKLATFDASGALKVTSFGGTGGGLFVQNSDDALSTLSFAANGIVRVFDGLKVSTLQFATPSGTGFQSRTITIPATTGTLISTGDTGTVTNTMLAGSIALSKLATTGTASASTYLRGDGAWSSIDLSAYLPLTGGTLTGVLAHPAGSASAPAITGTDSDSGIYFSTVNQIDFTTGGTRRWYIDSSGTLQGGTSSMQLSGNLLGTYFYARGGRYAIGASDDVIIDRDAAARLQLGGDHATTATNQTIKAHDVTTGTGASLDLRGGNGSTAGGTVTISTSATTTPAVRMTIKASGVINMSGMPTSSAGLSSGDLWNDAGTVKIVP